MEWRTNCGRVGVPGLGWFRVSGSGFKVQVYGSGFRVFGLGFRGLGFRVFTSLGFLALCLHGCKKTTKAPILIKQTKKPS